MTQYKLDSLTHWGRVTHICIGKLTIIGSDNGLSPEQRQAIIWTNAGILLIGPLGINFSEILIEIQTFSGLGLNELNQWTTRSWLAKVKYSVSQMSEKMEWAIMTYCDVITTSLHQTAQGGCYQLTTELIRNTGNHPMNYKINCCAKTIVCVSSWSLKDYLTQI